MKKLILTLILSISISNAQESIIASGTNDYTIGETFPIMQSDMKPKEVPLSVPKYEIPVPEPKPVITTKKNFFQKLIEVVLKIFKK